LNSSIATWFGPVVRTICGRSSIAGIDTVQPPRRD
jgi:hypothetical protein